MKKSLILFALLLTSTAIFAQSSADETAIKAVLEGHTQAGMDDDTERAVGYFADSPHTAISYQDGSGYIRGHKAVKDKYREVMNREGFNKSPDKLTTGDYLYRIMGSTAFVTYVETKTKPDGTAARTHKANYLEKEMGNASVAQWKMIGNFWMPEQKAK